MPLLLDLPPPPFPFCLCPCFWPCLCPSALLSVPLLQPRPWLSERLLLPLAPPLTVCNPAPCPAPALPCPCLFCLCTCPSPCPCPLRSVALIRRGTYSLPPPLHALPSYAGGVPWQCVTADQRLPPYGQGGCGGARHWCGAVLPHTLFLQHLNLSTLATLTLATPTHLQRSAEVGTLDRYVVCVWCGVCCLTLLFLPRPLNFQPLQPSTLATLNP